MIRRAAGARLQGKVLDNGCGVGMYIQPLSRFGGWVAGVEFDYPRAVEARKVATAVTNAAGEYLPFPEDTFDLILSNEVIEHVADDQLAIHEIVRVLRPGGRLVLFCPNRGYPFETHGVYWRGEYHFGNVPLVNYLPRRIRDKLAPHVRVYTRRDLERLFDGLPIVLVERRIIFGGYDNIAIRFPRLGSVLRSILYFLERTPFQVFGLSHFWVVEKQK